MSILSYILFGVGNLTCAILGAIRGVFSLTHWSFLSHWSFQSQGIKCLVAAYSSSTTRKATLIILRKIPATRKGTCLKHDHLEALIFLFCEEFMLKTDANIATIENIIESETETGMHIGLLYKS